VKRLEKLTPEQLARAERRLLHPAPGSRIEAGERWGLDLGQLMVQLRLSPAERARKLEDVATALESVRGIARRRR